MNGWAREGEWTAWMRAAISGDACAYHRFLVSVTPHLRLMARHRSRVAGAPERDVEDIVQEVLLAIHLKRGTWDQSRPIGPPAARPACYCADRRRDRHTWCGGSR